MPTEEDFSLDGQLVDAMSHLSSVQPPLIGSECVVHLCESTGGHPVALLGQPSEVSLVLFVIRRGLHGLAPIMFLSGNRKVSKL